MNKDLFLVPLRLANGFTEVNPEEDPYYVLQGALPRMFASSKVLDTVEQISESSKTVITAMIIIPIVAGIALNGILKKLWAMISTF